MQGNRLGSGLPRFLHQLPNLARAASSPRIPGRLSCFCGTQSGGNCVSKGRSCMRSRSESDDYFASRSWRSRLAAIASTQSAPVASRQLLIARLRETAERFGTPDPVTAPEDDQEPGLRLPRPAHWGGYRLWAAVVELWVRRRASPARSCALDPRYCSRRRRALPGRAMASRAPAALSTRSAPMLACRAVDVAVAGRQLVRASISRREGGEFIAVLGRNGVGKTLTLHTLAGLRAPAAGEVLLDGRDLAEWPGPRARAAAGAPAAAHRGSVSIHRVRDRADRPPSPPAVLADGKTRVILPVRNRHSRLWGLTS